MTAVPRNLISFAFIPLAGVLIFAQIAPGAVGDVHALENFKQVDGQLYRGAQPSREGFQELAELGIKTVVDLRGGEGRSNKEGQLVRALGMKYVNVPLDGYQAPASGDISKLLALLEDQSAGPVFVHCRRGADRTGTILAAYRIQHDHWSNQQALDEAKTMKMASSEKLMQQFVREFKPAAIVAAQ
jgi:tyrosine-protein phosphatase SIW14